MPVFSGSNIANVSLMLVICSSLKSLFGCERRREGFDIMLGVSVDIVLRKTIKSSIISQYAFLVY